MVSASPTKSKSKELLQGVDPPTGDTTKSPVMTIPAVVINTPSQAGTEELPAETPTVETVAGIEVDSTRAWIVCFCSCLQIMFVNSFTGCASIFFFDLINAFNISKAEASLVTSISFGTTRFFSPVSGNLVDKFGCRYVAFVGTVITGVSLFAASLAELYVVLLATQGVCFGIGVSLTYISAICSVRQVFRKHLSLATGLVLTGGGLGTFAMGAGAQALMHLTDWRLTYQVISAAIGGVSFFALPIVSLHRCRLCCRQEEEETQVKQTHETCQITVTIDCSVFQSRAYLVWLVAVSSWCTGYFVPYIHMTAYTVEKGITDNGYHIIMIFSVVLTVFRVASGKLLDLELITRGQNRFHIMQAMYLLTAINAALFPQARGYIGLVAYGVVQGIADGFLTVLTPILTSIIVGQDRTPIGFGYLLGINSIPYTVGPVLAGYIKDTTDTYDYAFYMCAAASFVAFLLLFMVKWFNAQEVRMEKLKLEKEESAEDDSKHRDDLPMTPSELRQRGKRSKASLFTTESIVMMAETQSKVVRTFESQHKMSHVVLAGPPHDTGEAVNFSTSHQSHKSIPLAPGTKKYPSKHPSVSSAWHESLPTIQEGRHLQTTSAIKKENAYSAQPQSETVQNRQPTAEKHAMTTSVDNVHILQPHVDGAMSSLKPHGKKKQYKPRAEFASPVSLSAEWRPMEEMHPYRMPRVQMPQVAQESHVSNKCSSVLDAELAVDDMNQSNAERWVSFLELGDSALETTASQEPCETDSKETPPHAETATCRVNDEAERKPPVRTALAPIALYPEQMMAVLNNREVQTVPQQRKQLANDSSTCLQLIKNDSSNLTEAPEST